jgi:hypothetical protein
MLKLANGCKVGGRWSCAVDAVDGVEDKKAAKPDNFADTS